MRLPPAGSPFAPVRGIKADSDNLVEIGHVTRIDLDPAELGIDHERHGSEEQIKEKLFVSNLVK
jgi:hypothetical protein